MVFACLAAPFAITRVGWPVPPHPSDVDFDDFKLKVALRAYKAEWKDKDKLAEASAQRQRIRNKKRKDATTYMPPPPPRKEEGWVGGWRLWTEEAAELLRMMNREYNVHHKKTPVTALFLLYLPITVPVDSGGSTTNAKGDIYLTEGRLERISKITGIEVMRAMIGNMKPRPKRLAKSKELDYIAEVKRSDVHAFFAILCDARASMAALEARAKDRMLDDELCSPR